MYFTIVILPLISGLTVGLFGRKLGVTGSYILSICSMLFTSILGYISFYEVIFSNSPVSLELNSWIDSEVLSLSWGFIFDELTVSMLLPVLTISLLVQIYSKTYMKEDPHNQRFFSYLSLFTFFMLLLISGDNYLILFIGWEGVGIMSFLLISFWYTRVQALKSAMSAVMFNRVGDMFFVLAMVTLLASVGSLKFSIIYSVAFYLNKTVLFLIGFCLIVAAMGKSAQLGLHVWLPQAMEGPTPVSALIHAATMVTAGVYLMLRSSPLIEFNSSILYIILWLGGITALVSGIIGLFQNDMKKIIAYSTCSQLGIMFVSIGLSQYGLALFHLINHAFFKALLFLSAGVVIHSLNDEQDIRKMGGLRPWMPLTYSFFLIGSLSLMAMPFLTGYYSKDMILEITLGKSDLSGYLIYCILTITSMITASYSFKVVYYTFLSRPASNKENYKAIHDVPSGMLFPLVFLSVCSIMWGYLTKDIFIGLGTSALGNSLFSSLEYNLFNVEFGLTVIFKVLPTILSISVLLLLFVIFNNYPHKLLQMKSSNIGIKLYSMFNKRGWLDLLYTNIIVRNVVNIGYYTNRYIDKGALEFIGPFGLYIMFTKLAKAMVNMDSGILRHYIIYICVGILVVINMIYYNDNIDYKLILVIFSSTILVLLNKT